MAVNRFKVVERELEIQCLKDYRTYLETNLHERNLLVKKLAKSLEFRLVELDEKEKIHADER
jgi:hypothetical protein